MILNGEINISEDEWIALNEKYTKDELKQMISDAIGDNNLCMPMRKITHEECGESFQELLNMDAKLLIKDSKWFTRYDYNPKYFKIDKIIKSNTTGNKAPDYYMQETRWACDSINAPSPYRSWNIERFRLTLLNALWTLKVKKVNSATLRSCIGLRKYIASQFRPSAAKAIYEYFSSKNVLDFSSGWGDRLTGFLASDGESYTGIDPNANLYDNYQKIVDRFNTGKDIKLNNACAEDISFEDKKFDTIFTSPPYFNIERYTQEDNQSFKKYRKLDKWLADFLFKVLGNFWNNLAIGGHMIINISDVYSNHTINNICDPMNDFISSLVGSEYIGCMGYEMRKRPNSGALKNKTGVFAEPIWIWKKVN